MAVTWSKLLAAAIAVGYFIAALVIGIPSFGMAVTLVLALLLPLTLIWYPEIGSSWPRKKTILYTYEDDRPYQRPGRRDSHPAMVVFMGWFFLIGLPLVLWLIARAAEK